MNSFALIEDDAEEPTKWIPEAPRWQSALVVSKSDNCVGIGFILVDSSGYPLMGVNMTPQQAARQARYLMRVASRMLLHTDREACRELAEQQMADAIQLLMEKADKDARAP